MNALMITAQVRITRIFTQYMMHLRCFRLLVAISSIYALLVVGQPARKTLKVGALFARDLPPAFAEQVGYETSASAMSLALTQAKQEHWHKIDVDYRWEMRYK